MSSVIDLFTCFTKQTRLEPNTFLDTSAQECKVHTFVVLTYNLLFVLPVLLTLLLFISLTPFRDSGEDIVYLWTSKLNGAGMSEESSVQ